MSKEKLEKKREQEREKEQKNREEFDESLRFILSTDSVLILEDAIYKIALYDENREFTKDCAYLDGDYYYLYRGKKARYEMNKPGVYLDSATGKVVKIDPMTPEEKEKYNSNGKIVSYDPSSIANLINENEELFVPISESSKLFNPEITVEDDILKRILKMLFIEKEVEIDNYKDRFPDKNALFNFKQVMKNKKSRVTMKIFERACDVVGVEYVIIIREKDKSKSIGKRLDHDIVVSSEDTYDYGAVAAALSKDPEEEE